MPKILIREKDNTSAGSLGAYTNYSVLIPGFSSPDAPRNTESSYVEADDNNVYELTSISEFNNMIGEVPVVYSNLKELAPEHYGNRMAKLLLDIGYSVLYIDLGPMHAKKGAEDKEITKCAQAYAQKLVDLTSEDFWKPFKDRAEYDFRFVSHGLLSSVEHEIPASEVAGWKTEETLLSAGLSALNAVSEDFTADQVSTLYEDATAKDSTTKFIQPILDLFKVIVDSSSKVAEDDVSEDSKKAAEDTIAETLEVLNTEKETLVDSQEVEIANYKTLQLLYNAFSTDVEEDKNIVYDASDFTGAYYPADLDNDKSIDINSTGINAANKAIANLAAYLYDETTHEPKPNTGRGDCTALIELDETTYVNDDVTVKPVNKIINAVKAYGKQDQVGRFCACTVPSVVYNIDGVNVKVPGAMHYLECFASSLGKGYDEWFAAAGFSRGLSAHTVAYTTVRLGDTAVNALEPRFIEDQQNDPPFAVNVIACFRGNYYLWGNRTCEPLGDKNDAKLGNLTAKHFLNIRQLCTTLKKQIYVSCRSFTFDPNSDVLWINFCNAIKPTLERMKANQGIREYKIEKAFTDKKATLAARIRIVPIEAVEDFDIEISLEDSLGGMVVETVD